MPQTLAPSGIVLTEPAQTVRTGAEAHGTKQESPVFYKCSAYRSSEGLLFRRAAGHDRPMLWSGRGVLAQQAPCRGRDIILTHQAFADQQGFSPGILETGDVGGCENTALRD